MLTVLWCQFLITSMLYQSYTCTNNLKFKQFIFGFEMEILRYKFPLLSLSLLLFVCPPHRFTWTQIHICMHVNLHILTKNNIESWVITSLNHFLHRGVVTQLSNDNPNVNIIREHVYFNFRSFRFRYFTSRHCRTAVTFIFILFFPANNKLG